MRLLARVLPLLAVPFALAACGGSGDGTTTATKAQTGPGPTLTAPPTLRIPPSVDPDAAENTANIVLCSPPNFASRTHR